MASEPGDTLSHYRLIEKIGEGGMGVVWKALDTTLDREVAIKILPPGIAEDRERLVMFEREAKAVAALNHPNIVTIHSIEEAGGVRFFTMELIPGSTLVKLIPPGGLPLGRFLEVAVPLVDAVAAAHGRGIVHRDLKPANVMVTESGRLKVLDFGLSKAMPTATVADSVRVTRGTVGPETHLSGTVPYMSPEQIQGKALDHRSDIFSLGIILYEMATGVRPFQGATPLQIIASILKDTPRPLSEMRADFPDRAEQILSRCLEKDQARRLQSAQDLRHELEELAREVNAARKASAPSVAVLPFVDMSPNKDQEYFCEGMAEEIINALGKVENLRVASRTSAFRFKSTALDARDIGRQLGVSALLEGSVRKAGERLRIGAELTGVADGYCLWSGRYDRDLRDVFAIQEEIARSIVQALEVTLSASESRTIRATPTTDVQAYDYYLRGRKFFHQYSKRGMGFALEMFSRAIECDPDYALAHAGIADCYSFLYMFVDRSAASRDRVDAASRKALELAPGLAQAHASRALALSLQGQHEEAGREFESAIRLDPSLFEAAYFYARDCFAQGKLEAAVGLYERAMELRPEDYQAPLLAAQIYFDLGRPADADAARKRGLSIVEEHLKTRPDDIRALYMGANALVAIGERERGLEWARRAVALDPDDSILLYNVACIRALAGEPEEALDCLEQAMKVGLVQKEWIVNDSNLEALRDHPRYRALLGLME